MKTQKKFNSVNQILPFKCFTTRLIFLAQPSQCISILKTAVTAPSSFFWPASAAFFSPSFAPSTFCNKNQTKSNSNPTNTATEKKKISSGIGNVKLMSKKLKAKRKRRKAYESGLCNKPRPFVSLWICLLGEREIGEERQFIHEGVGWDVCMCGACMYDMYVMLWWLLTGRRFGLHLFWTGTLRTHCLTRPHVLNFWK